ncbi:MAG TPA: hypothetical protein ENJ59_01245 [Thermofilum sp.]|nr:hypothetical protein [Thermofilum sp.]
MAFKRKKSKKASRIPKDPRKPSARVPNYRVVRDRMLRNAYIILIVGILTAFLAPIFQTLATSPSIDAATINQVIMSPPSLLSIVILAVSVPLSVFLVVKAYTVYLYFRLVDALTRLTESVAPRQVQPTAPVTPQPPQQVARPHIQPQIPQQQIPAQSLPQTQPRQHTPSSQLIPTQRNVPLSRETIQQPPLRTPSVQQPATTIPRQPSPPQPTPSKPFAAPSISPPATQTEKKRCPYCGRELPFGDLHTVCPYCGRRLK